MKVDLKFSVRLQKIYSKMAHFLPPEHARQVNEVEWPQIKKKIFLAKDFRKIVWLLLVAVCINGVRIEHHWPLNVATPTLLIFFHYYITSWQALLFVQSCTSYWSYQTDAGEKISVDFKLFPNQPNTFDKYSIKLIAINHTQNVDWDWKSAN